MRKLSDSRFDPFRIPHPMGDPPPELRDYAGAFVLPFSTHNQFKQLVEVQIRVIASRGGPVWDRGPGADWDHVSVSLANRTPTWQEMSFIKEKFFFANEVAMQLHPVAEYINNHPYCLHLWRPLKVDIPLPSSILVGLKELNP